MANKSKQAQAAPAAKKQPRNLVDQFKAAIRVSTPLVAITTADQFALVHKIVAQVNGSRAFIRWDCMNGFAALNKASAKALAVLGSENIEVTNFAEAARVAQEFSKVCGDDESQFQGVVVFMLNAQRFIDDAREAQAVCNLRDHFKQHGCCLVLLAPQLKLPAELAHDVVKLDEPLPDEDQLAAIVKEVHANAAIEAHPEAVGRAVEAVQGLSAFEADQVTAMSLAVEGGQITGLDFDSLWDRKREQIEQTPGLAVNRDGITFDDLGGLEIVKGYLMDLMRGNARPHAIVFVDELEKVMAGAQGDTSGVSQDQHQCLLSHMQNSKASGCLLVGHPGSGKSATAKAAGNAVGIPTITLDLGATKGGIVGQSESQLREALKVIDAVSNGNALWLATSNGIGSISPELKRRFKDGLFFFDLPTKDERAAIWKVHRKAFGINPADLQPQDEGWTGAEIEQCCRLAWRLNKPLLHASGFVVPVSQASPDAITALRHQANGRWLSASNPGVYRMDDEAEPLAVAQQPTGRKIKAVD